MGEQNIFVLGLNDFNRRKLERLPGGEEYRFHGVLDPDEILEAAHFPMADLLRRAGEEIERAGTPVDAILGYVDFPVSTMLPILGRRFGLRAPSLESLLKCEHKYWSRLVQREVVPEHIPQFQAFDPFADNAADQVTLDFPLWVKPVKSAGSYLGFRVNDRTELESAIELIRKNIGVFGEPFNHILGYAELPPEVAKVDGNYCLAESIIGGRQCTVEGCVFDGEVLFHGVVDSIRAKERSTFLRYQYPSRLPGEVKERMKEVIRRVLTHIGFDNSSFNIEFFWDREEGRLWLLEINTRIAQHHSDLFEKVDGVTNHRIALDVALGRRPEIPRGSGPFDYAGCCWLRRYRDGVVTRVPSDREIEALESEVPGLEVELHVKPGQRLSELTHQESYSYVLAILYVGGESPEALRETYRACRRKLRFEFEE